jgi:erythromycin esterase-like protein
MRSTIIECVSLALVFVFCSCGSAGGDVRSPGPVREVTVVPVAVGSNRPLSESDYLGFEDPSGLRWKHVGQGFRYEMESTERRSGNHSLAIVHEDGDGVSISTAVTDAVPFRGRRFVLEGWVKRIGATRGRLSLYARADAADGDRLMLENMLDSGMTVDGDWREIELGLDVPVEAATIKFGVLLTGDGRAWADDLVVSVGDQVPRAPRDISIMVVDLNGTPVRRAAIALNQGASVSQVGFSDSSGGIKLVTDLGGSLEVSATHPSLSADFAVVKASDRLVQLTLGKRPGRRLAGRLRRQTERVPSLFYASAVSNETGDTFAVPVDPDGSYSVILPTSAMAFRIVSILPGVAIVPDIFDAIENPQLTLDEMAEPDVTTVEEITESCVPVTRQLVLEYTKDSRLIAFGEATHGSREVGDANAQMLQTLVESGGQWLVALEAERAAVAMADEFVRGGDGDARVIVRQLGVHYANESTAMMLLWLREWNSTHSMSVRVVGIDMQDPRGAVRRLQQIGRDLTDADRGVMDNLLQEPVRERWEQLFKRPTAQASLLELLRRLERGRHGSDAEERHEILANTAIIRQWLAFELALRVAGGRDDNWKIRERALAENMLREVRVRPHARVVLFAHNDHVDKGEPETLSVGALLRKQLGNEVFVIGTMLGVGSFQAVALHRRMGMRAFPIPPPQNWDIAAAFRKVEGGPCVVKLRGLESSRLAAWFSQRHEVREYGWLYDPKQSYPRAVRMGRRFDAIVYFSETSRAIPIRD